jgi:hypothetical protein
MRGQQESPVGGAPSAMQQGARCQTPLPHSHQPPALRTCCQSGRAPSASAHPDRLLGGPLPSTTARYRNRDACCCGGLWGASGPSAASSAASPSASACTTAARAAGRRGGAARAGAGGGQARKRAPETQQSMKPGVHERDLGGGGFAHTRTWRRRCRGARGTAAPAARAPCCSRSRRCWRHLQHARVWGTRSRYYYYYCVRGACVDGTALC